VTARLEAVSAALERRLRAHLIEWDTDIPELSVLLGEANVADRLLEALASEGGDHACAA
jgi:uncharacterized protein (UPF0276 family)